MLKNLLKHELKYAFKYLSIFYIISLVSALLTRLFLGIENSLIFDIIGKVCSGITISMVVNIVVNNTLRFWVRFKQTLYGDESYLTHTLPVKTSTIYASKMIAGLITLLASILVIALSLFVAYYSKENLEMIKHLLFTFEAVFDISFWGLITFFFAILFIQYSCIIQCGFTGIILGHKMQSGKVGLSVLFGFIVYSVIQTLVLLSVFIIALFNTRLMNFFTTNAITSVDTFKTLLALIGVIYLVFVAIGFIINTKLLKKGVNVE